MTVGRTAEGFIPTVTHLRRVFQCSRMLQYTAWCSTVCIKLTAVFFSGNGKTDSILRHCNRTVSHKTVKSKTWDMKYVCRFQTNRSALCGLCLISRGLIFIVKLTFIISVHRHAVWHKRIQSHNLTLSVSDNLCIGIAPQKQMRHKCFPEHKACHFRVWLIMQYKIQRMSDCLFLTSVICISV